MATIIPERNVTASELQDKSFLYLFCGMCTWVIVCMVKSKGEERQNTRRVRRYYGQKMIFNRIGVSSFGEYNDI